MSYQKYYNITWLSPCIFLYFLMFHDVHYHSILKVLASNILFITAHSELFRLMLLKSWSWRHRAPIKSLPKQFTGEERLRCCYQRNSPLRRHNYQRTSLPNSFKFDAIAVLSLQTLLIWLIDFLLRTFPNYKTCTNRIIPIRV